MIQWKDTFLFFCSSGVRSYNFTTEEWSPTFVSYFPASSLVAKIALLPNDQVLIVGSYCPVCPSVAYIYNITGQTWSNTGTPAKDPSSAALVQLGQRYFLMGGISNVTEEYNYNTRAWSIVNTRPVNNYLFSPYYAPTSAIAVPAEMFASLPKGCQGIN